MVYSLSLRVLYTIAVLFIFGLSNINAQEYVLVIHGGAGAMKRSQMTDAQAVAYEKALNEALDVGSKILAEGGSSMDAIIAAIQLMEEASEFNAGIGAVFTHDMTVELDASIMDGRDLGAGAVAGVKTIKSPIQAARAVMEHSPHVMLSGKGAESFASEQGLDMVENTYFHTTQKLNTLKRVQEREEARKKSQGLLYTDEEFRAKMGTVGAVALDKNGNLAAGTSTGGMTNKRWGRIGDAPIIGAGTYANNESVAVSCTGHGEYFIRHVVGHDLSAMMLYGNLSLQEASDRIIYEKLKGQGAGGGLIAVDKNGNIAMPFNTANMFRGYQKGAKTRVVKIGGQE